MRASLARQLRAEPPPLHAGDHCAGLHWPALEWLETTVEPGWETLETGAGLSTIVFAARGARHEAITPAAEEAAAIRAELERRAIPPERVTFHVGPSHEVLPAWQPRPLDLVLLDGAHGFPYPILDWWYVMPHVKKGALLVLDDAYMAGVRVLLEYLDSRPSWDVAQAVGYRTVVVRKVDDEEPPFDPFGTDGGRSISFAYLPLHRRALASTRHRIFSTRAGMEAVRQIRRRAPFLFR